MEDLSKTLIKKFTDEIKNEDKEEWKKLINFINKQYEFYNSIGSAKRHIWKKVLVNMSNKYGKKFIGTEWIKKIEL